MAFEKKRNVSEHPPFREEDVGHPLPDSEYAVSVSLPTWDSVIGYEESQDSVLEKLKTGYPRFFLSPIIKSLENRVLSEFNVSEDFGCLIFNLESVAVRCREFILNRHDGWEVVVKPICQGNAFTVIFPKQVQDVAKKFWRFFGEGLSVRCAKSLLAENYKVDPRGNDALLAIKNRIAEDTGKSAEDVYIYPSGMAAVSAVHRALTHITPGARSIQFDFPYVDVLKIQKEIGSGVVFLPAADEQSISRLDSIVNNGEKICGIYCELPSNPLLRSADLNSIKRITGSLNIPIVVDDTVATNVNVDVLNGLKNIKQLHLANLNILSNKFQLEDMKENVSLLVANSFLQILFNKELLKVQKIQYDLSIEDLSRAQELVENGVLPVGDLYELEANKSSAEKSLIDAENALTLAKLALAQLILIENYQEFENGLRKDFSDFEVVMSFKNAI